MLTRLSFLVFFYFFSFAFSYEQVCDYRDQSSLLAFSENISASPPVNWPSLISCCQWKGIRCDANGRVTHLHLPSRGLEGTISSSIGNLVRLTHLNLSRNDLNGTLREDIFDGLTNLRVIDLSSNNILGFVPRNIGKLLHLKKLHLYDNNFHGPIPSSLSNCSHLEEIILRDNLLNGDISNFDFSRLDHFRKLDLANNQFTGTIPKSIFSCKSLIAIRLARNYITGEISSNIARLKSLSFLSLSINSLTNITATLRVLARCKNLTTLFLSDNFYNESLPIHSNFIGLDEFSNLQYLELNNCNFSGHIPNWLFHLKRLRILKLGNNKMTGRIPGWLGTLPHLMHLDLSNNGFIGDFPRQLCELTVVSKNVDVSVDYSHFELPVFSVGIPLSNGSVLVFLDGVAPQLLDLSFNRLSGNIPLEIGNLQNLQVLDLSHNNFFGHIPLGMSNLKNLLYLDLARNGLTGEIPTSLESLHFLAYFNVSYNELEGTIPTNGQLDTFDESSFRGNPRLCGEQLDHPCIIKSRQNVAHREYVHHERMQEFVNGLFVGFSFGFSGVFAIVASYFWFHAYERCQKKTAGK